MATGISRAIRRFVSERAGQVDHIISLKHGGTSDTDNLAYVCLRCNLWKGTDVAAIEATRGTLVRLFDPRRQKWQEHFTLRGTQIEALTDEGAATVRLLKLNLDKRLDERRLLIAVGRYPR